MLIYVGNIVFHLCNQGRKECLSKIIEVLKPKFPHISEANLAGKFTTNVNNQKPTLEYE